MILNPPCPQIKQNKKSTFFHINTIQLIQLGWFFFNIKSSLTPTLTFRDYASQSSNSISPAPQGVNPFQYLFA